MKHYTIDYFIQTYEALEDDWLTLSSEPQHPMDAWEWLTEPEAWGLYEIIKPYGLLIEANDGLAGWDSYGNIKERVVGFLEYVKVCIQMEAKDAKI